MKKTLVILLAVGFILSMTIAAASAHGDKRDGDHDVHHHHHHHHKNFDDKKCRDDACTADNEDADDNGNADDGGNTVIVVVQNTNVNSA
jgi:hypothetical protein